MLLSTSARHFTPALIAFALCATDAAGLTLYRLGTPFSAAERDSLQDLGIDFSEISWTFSYAEEGLELDSLGVGSLQPNYFDENEDIVPTALSTGGWISIAVADENTLLSQVLVDGDPSTAYVWKAITGSAARLARVTLDMGGHLLVKKVRFHPTAEYPGRFAEGFRIGFGDAVQATSCGKCIGNLPPAMIRKQGGGALAETVTENTDPEVTVLVEPPHGLETRFLQLQIQRATGKAVEVAEFEVFGGGFISRASYQSDIIELDNVASWGALTWSGRQDPRARVDTRTRTGTDPHPEVFWEARPEQQDSVRYREGGGTMTAREYRAAYDLLPAVFKPVDEENWVSPDSENWSFWSSPYDFESRAADVVSPSSRQFIQLRADFQSAGLDGGRIDYLEFRASVPPAVRAIVAEIYPSQTRLGEVTRFTYFIKPTIRAGDQGFDSVEIATPSGFRSVDSLRIEGVDQVEFAWTPKLDGLGFEVQLPRRMGTTDSGTVLEVVFNAPVLREVGSFFDGKVFDSAHPHEVRQRITPGNAADEVESDLLSVRTSMSRSLLFRPAASPTPFTPNGDGINDAVAISYTLLRVTAPVRVSVTIHDLSGALVKRVYVGDDPLGEHARLWDGTDTSNRSVAPGIYLYRIEVDLHTSTEVSNGVVPVAY